MPNYMLENFPPTQNHIIRLRDHLFYITFSILFLRDKYIAFFPLKMKF